MSTSRAHGAHRAVAAAAALIALAAVASPVFAHEVRDVAGYQFVVGFIDEPVYTGQKSGLEFEVTRDGAPVTGLAETLSAEVTYGEATRDLPLSPRFGEDGWYQSYFVPTAAGAYTFHIHGTIEGQAVNETFTSSPDGFREVQEVTAGQFPETLPSARETADLAARGAAAADQLTLAFLVGGAGVVMAIVAIGLALAARRRTT